MQHQGGLSSSLFFKQRGKIMEINLGVVATVCSILFGYLGYSKGQKDEYKKNGKSEGILNTDIQYIKKRTDEVLLEQKDTNKKYISFRG